MADVRGSLVASAIAGFLTITRLAAQTSTPITHPDPAPGDAPVPEAWGPDNFTLYRVAAAGFSPMSSATGFIPFFGSKKCLAPTPSCFLAAPLPLPSGVRVAGIFLEGCDNDAAGEYLNLLLYRCPGPVGLCTVEASASTSGVTPAPGCSYVASAALDLTINDIANTYYLQIEISGTEVEFRSAAVAYYLQVSPPPAFATFNDVPVSHPQFQFIEALAASGISVGCGGNNFCPSAALTRGQAAVFLARALGLHWLFLAPAAGSHPAR